MPMADLTAISSGVVLCASSVSIRELNEPCGARGQAQRGQQKAIQVDTADGVAQATRIFTSTGSL